MKVVINFLQLFSYAVFSDHKCCEFPQLSQVVRAAGNKDQGRIC